MTAQSGRSPSSLSLCCGYTEPIIYGGVQRSRESQVCQRCIRASEVAAHSRVQQKPEANVAENRVVKRFVFF